MYFILLVLWIYLLIILTCTKNLSGLVRGEPASFELTSNPNFTYFFNINVYTDPSLAFIVQKAGHFICFFILAALLFQVCKTIWSGIGWALFWATTTELVQPFFHREGLFVDMIINSLGVLSYTLLYWLVNVLINRAIRTEMIENKRSRIV